MPSPAVTALVAAAAFGAATSAVSFWRRRSLDRDRAALGFVAGFAGSLIGARAVLAVPVAPLRGIVMVLLLGAAAVVLARRNVVPRPHTLSPAAARAALAGIALALGAYDGFFGPGTGSML